MKAVLYTEDMEPITVVKLQPWAVDFLERTGHVRLHVLPPFDVRVPDPDAEPIPDFHGWIVRLTAHPIVNAGQRKRHMLLTVDNDSGALLLPAVFLPGQTDALNRRASEARGAGLLEGFNAALHMLGRG